MGLFNYVNATHDCWLCDQPVTGWQTKDGDPFMETVEVDEPDLFEYYSSCSYCDANSDYRFSKETCSWVLYKSMGRSRRDNDIALDRIMGKGSSFSRRRLYPSWQLRAKGVAICVDESGYSDTFEDVLSRERRASETVRYRRDMRARKSY